MQLPSILRPAAAVLGFVALLAAAAATGADVDQTGERSTRQNYADDENYDNQIWRWSNSQIRGISEARLPDTQPGRTWRFELSPRFGDFFNREYVRLRTGVTYGITDRTEVEIEVDPYFPNPFKDGGEWGLANYFFATKHQWSAPTAVDFATASGVQIRIPVENAPFDANEGVNRYSFFTTFGKQPWDLHDVYVYMNLGFDMLTESRAEGSIPDWKPQDDFTEIVLGALYHREGVVWGLSVGWQHTVDGPSDDYLTVTPSATFDVPRKYVFNLPGRWQLGTAVEFRYHDGSIDPHFRAKARWIIDFQRAVDHLKERVPMPSIPFMKNGNGDE